MQNQTNKTNLVSPQSPNKAQMAMPSEPPAEPKDNLDLDAEKKRAQKEDELKKAPKVKIRALGTIRLSTGEHMVKGQEMEVSAVDAVEFCDKIFKGNYAFSGEREGTDQVNSPRHYIKRAERVI